jgi:diadenosine tetraphosphatase ApaH/serine/threonine PP2A family protein phosphatase
MSGGLEGLRVHVITAPTGDAFITCDNPAYRYNQYCEGVGWQGLTGALCRGLQVFLPLSPLVSVLLFDGGVYKVGRRGVAPSSQATERDAEFLNTIQLLAAAENVYFAGWGSVPEIQRLARSIREERSRNRLRVMEAYEVGNPRSSLIHQYEEMPDLNLQLSFVSLRRDARRVALEARARLLRKKPPPELDAPALDPDNSRPRIFETRVRQ